MMRRPSPSSLECAAALRAAWLLLLVALGTACTRHEAILQPRGLAFTPVEGRRTIGHLTTTTWGLNLLLTWAVAPGGSLAHQHTYDQFAVEAGAHGTGKVLDLAASRTQVPLLPPILWLHVVTVSGNLVE